MIKIINGYRNGDMETKEVDEMDFASFATFSDIFDKMQEKNCSTIVVQLDKDRQVLFTLTLPPGANI